ncbi:MAG: CHAT domain-containing protein, partial [Blastocatellia bacterium]
PAVPTRAKTPVLLVVGNPALNELTVERIRALLPAERASDAFDWRKEMDAVSSAYGEGQRVVYTGADASEERLKQEAGKFRVLHLASRMILNEAAPLYSAVALAAATDGGEDGMLDLREVIGLDLKPGAPRLIVLSATEPALPQAGASRSLTGLAWALYIAGCPAALIKQWRTEPSAAADLMPAFHRALNTSGKIAKSWQAAVKQAMSREEHRHPYFWAGYQLLGDARR